MTKRTKAILSLGGLFLLGALCGALALGMFVRSEVRSAQRLRDRDGFREYFADELELTRAQRDSLQGELDWFYGQLAGLRTAAAGEFHDLLDSLDARLVTHLSNDQVTRLRSAEGRLRQRVAGPRPAPLSDVDDRAGATGASAPTAVAPDTTRTSRSHAASTAPAPPTKSDAGRTGSAARRDSVASVADTAAASLAEADPGEPIEAVGSRLGERLGLDAAQSDRIRAIVMQTRRSIKADVAGLRGYPRLQLESARQHLRAMDRQILDVLDAQQRAKYEPIRDELARRMRARIMKQIRPGRNR
jgi:hypothetical protein